MGIFSPNKPNFDPLTGLPELHGKVAIVTGASSGLGVYTVLHLARKGARVYLGARSQIKYEQAVHRLHEEGLDSHSAGEVKWINVDLTDPREAKKAAEWFYTQESRLDILVNNAGKQIGPYGLTADGISDSFMINHISPFVFTQALLPLLEKTSQAGEDVRIVNLASMAHTMVSYCRYESLQSLNNDFSRTLTPQTSVYGYSKLAVILYTRELQRQLDEKGSNVTVLCVHPGSVLTDKSFSFCSGHHLAYALQTNIKFASTFFCGWFVLWVMSLSFIRPSEGAHTSVFAAASPEIRRRRDHFKGQYIVPGNDVGETSADGKKMDLARELWDTTEALLKDLDV